MKNKSGIPDEGNIIVLFGKEFEVVNVEQHDSRHVTINCDGLDDAEGMLVDIEVKYDLPISQAFKTTVTGL